jgi:curved DNA-binding protein CbpA
MGPMPTIYPIGGGKGGVGKSFVAASLGGYIANSGKTVALVDYEILQVAPNAGQNEIRRAYRDALAIYEEEGVATYSLFSDRQRETLLSAIESAYHTLIDEDRRTAYDQTLIDARQVDASIFSSRTRRQLAARSDAGSPSKAGRLSQWVSKRAAAPEIQERIEAIMSGEQVSGPALKQLREAYGIDLSEIYALTRISSDVLKRIEADQFEDLPAAVYLRQFLKTYAGILQIDAGHVVDGYIKSMTQHPRDH